MTRQLEMEEENFLQFENLKLTKSEQEIAILEDENIEEIENKLQNALICKILTAKIVNEDVFKSMMPMIWNIREEVTI